MRLPAAIYTQENFWYSFLLEAESVPWAIGLDQMKKKNPMISPGIEPATFRLVS
jgi:hypothetical protein